MKTLYSQPLSLLDVRCNQPVSGPTRRSVLAMLTATSAIGLLPQQSWAQTAPLSIPGAERPPTIDEVPFSEPQVVRSEGGVLSTTLTVDFREETIDGRERQYRTYNGLFTGPTLRFSPGDTVRVLVDNNLPSDSKPSAHEHDPNVPHGFNTTNLHTHGLWVSPAGNSDNVLIAIEPDKTFQHEYLIPDTHIAGTFWYHPHKHGSVERQVSQGMSGAIIIEGGMDEMLEIGGAKERLMVIQQIQPEPDPAKAATIRSVKEIAGAPNKKTTINALRAPTLTMAPKAVERWRLIAANYHDLLHIEAQRIGSVDKLPLYPIAYDGIPVREVRETTRIRLAPGNRIDVLVQPLEEGDYQINKIGDGGQFDTKPEDEVIGFLKVLGPPRKPMTIPTTIPDEYSHDPIKEEDVTRRRKVLYSIISEGEGKTPRFVIDNHEFEPGRVDQLMKLGAVEEWRIENDSGAMHPFHIHVNPFEIVESSDPQIKAGTWLDTVPIPPASNGTPGYVVMRTRVERFIGDFVQHCHILGHEDRGMMQLIRIEE